VKNKLPPPEEKPFQSTILFTGSQNQFLIAKQKFLVNWFITLLCQLLVVNIPSQTKQLAAICFVEFTSNVSLTHNFIRWSICIVFAKTSQVSTSSQRIQVGKMFKSSYQERKARTGWSKYTRQRWWKKMKEMKRPKNDKEQEEDDNLDKQTRKWKMVISKRRLT